MLEHLLQGCSPAALAHFNKRAREQKGGKRSRAKWLVGSMVTPPPCQYYSEEDDSSRGGSGSGADSSFVTLLTTALPPPSPSLPVSTVTSTTSVTSANDPAEVECRRGLSRSSQPQYREREHQYEKVLRVPVVGTQTKVHEAELELQRAGGDQDESKPQYSLTAADPGILQIARNFVHCFRSGFVTATSGPWLPLPPSPQAGSRAEDGSFSTRRFEGQEQIHFVHTAVHPDVLHGELRGQNAFLEQWRRYTAFFGSLALQASSFELLCRLPDRSVCRVQLTLSLEIIRSTFQHLLPHLSSCSSLTARLLGQQLQVPVTLTLEFDPQGRLCCYDAIVNFVQALRPVVSSYADVAVVLHGAHITAAGQLGQDVAELARRQVAVRQPTTPRDARLGLAFILCA